MWAGKKVGYFKASIVPHLTIMKLLNNVCMEESNDPVDGDKDEHEQGVVHKGKPKC